MIPKTHIDAIELIALKLEAAKLPYALVGSCNLALQGIEVTPNDVDISVHKDHLVYVRDIFKTHNPTEITEYKTTTSKQAWGVKMTINNVPVEFVGENDDGLYYEHVKKKQYTRHYHANETPVNCLNLSLEEYNYRITNRPEKAALVKKEIDRMAKALTCPG
ncbi:hypothetical protein J4219_01325 [Candidatus Woesearchaeota archaeon]|nr:hypothetical protein [Candidatus Woesearchaeota archaeon]